MIWSNKFQDRFLEWNRLRTDILSMSKDQALLEVNNWWQRAPMVNHYLHWDDWHEWPDPWTLLSDDVWCDVAKALGIMYTLMLAQHPEITDYHMIKCTESNLVQVDRGKYILNWAPGEIVNIFTNEDYTIEQTIEQKQLEYHLK